MTISKLPGIFNGFIVNILDKTAIAFFLINGLVLVVSFKTCDNNESDKSLLAIVPKQLKVAEHSTWPFLNSF